MAGQEATGATGLAVGIDVAEERKGLDLVALDGGRGIACKERALGVEAAALLVSELRPAVVCIDGPSGWSTSGRSREAERQLRRIGITAFPTGPDPGDHPFYRWMRAGMRLYAALLPAYPTYRGGEAAGTAAEVFPEATAVLLAGHRRPPGQTKGTFRRRVLAAEGVEVGALSTLDQVDAALAALTGLLALEGRGVGVGDPREGSILLPVTRLPEAPLRRPRAELG